MCGNDAYLYQFVVCDKNHPCVDMMLISTNLWSVIKTFHVWTWCLSHHSWRRFIAICDVLTIKLLKLLRDSICIDNSFICQLLQICAIFTTQLILFTFFYTASSLVCKIGNIFFYVHIISDTANYWKIGWVSLHHFVSFLAISYSFINKQSNWHTYFKLHTGYIKQ